MRKIPKLRFKEFSDEWEEKKLGEITKITAGGTPSTTKTEYWNGNIKWMNSGELNLKYVHEVQGRITEEGLKNSSTKLIPKNCVLIGLAGQGKTRGTVAINFIELCTNQSIASILPNYQSFIPLFLYFNLDNRYEELRGLSTGSGGRGGLNLGILNSLTSNFPSLQEQEKIANFLSNIDKKISLIEEKLELFREYKKGVMQKIFSQELRFKDSNGNDYPEWEEKKLGEILKEYYLGSNYKNSDKLSNFPLIKMGNLDRGKINLKKIEYIDIKENILEKDRLEYGTLLFNTRNTPELVGKVAIWKNELPQAYFNSNLMKMVFDNNFFMNYKFNTNDMIEKLKGIATGTTSVGAIYTKDLLKLVVVIPPSLEEQQKIADFLSSIDSKIESIEKELKVLKEFKKGLLQQMFV